MSWWRRLLTHIKTAEHRSLYSNTVIGTLADDRWAVTFNTANRSLGGCGPAQFPARCTKCNSPPISGQCTNSMQNCNYLCTVKGKFTDARVSFVLSSISDGLIGRSCRQAFVITTASCFRLSSSSSLLAQRRYDLVAVAVAADCRRLRRCLPSGSKHRLPLTTTAVRLQMVLWISYRSVL